jgi:hypothetical protein
MVALCMKKRISILAGPMIRVNCCIFSPLAWPLFSPSCPHMRILMTTDDINMPQSSSVEHTNQKFGWLVINGLRKSYRVAASEYILCPMIGC